MLGRVIMWLMIGGAVLFAIQGGEYSTLDLWKQRQRKVKLEARVEALSREVDSLRRAAIAIQQDRATQERIAREQFGMVKGDKEILYRFDSAADSTPDR